MKKFCGNLWFSLRCCYPSSNNESKVDDGPENSLEKSISISSGSSLKSSLDQSQTSSFYNRQMSQSPSCFRNWIRPLMNYYLPNRFNRNKKLDDGPDVVKLLLIGLDNAGKTTLALHLTGESVDDVVSTMGFSKYELKLKNNRFEIVLYDVGGGERIRGIWKNYYSLVHGIIFIIDSADLERILEVKQLIEETVSNPLVSGKPILIFLNKQDIHEAMDEIDLCKFTNVEDLMAKHSCANKIVLISAKQTKLAMNNTNNHQQQQQQQQIDPTIESGIDWLLDVIQEQWIELNERVENESKQQISKENDTMQRRIEKIQRRNIIELEYKVSKVIEKSDDEAKEQKTKMEVIVEKIENPNSVDNEESPTNDKASMPVYTNEDQQRQQMIIQKEDDDEEKTEMVKRQSSAPMLQHHQQNRPPLKRSNKIHPSSG